MFRSLLKWAVLIFLIIESLALIASALELGLKASTSSLGWSRALYGVAALEVILRFAIVGLLFPTYFHLRSVARLPLIVTRQSAMLNARAAHSGLLAAIAFYALASELTPALPRSTQFLSVWTVSPLALSTIVLTLFLRRRFFLEVSDQLRHDPTSVTALGQWQKFTILFMVLAMTVGLYGFILRLTGSARVVEWVFLTVAILLLVLWTPRLEEMSGPPSKATTD